MNHAAASTRRTGTPSRAVFSVVGERAHRGTQLAAVEEDHGADDHDDREDDADRLRPVDPQPALDVLRVVGRQVEGADVGSPLPLHEAEQDEREPE